MVTGAGAVRDRGTLASQRVRVSQKFTVGKKQVAGAVGPVRLSGGRERKG